MNHNGRRTLIGIGSRLDPGVRRRRGHHAGRRGRIGRTGADIVKALALGARAVLVGRPWVYGLGLGGTDGVRHVLRSLVADLDLGMALSGHRTVADITRDSLVRRP